MDSFVCAVQACDAASHHTLSLRCRSDSVVCATLCCTSCHVLPYPQHHHACKAWQYGVHSMKMHFFFQKHVIIPQKAASTAGAHRCHPLDLACSCDGIKRTLFRCRSVRTNQHHDMMAESSIFQAPGRCRSHRRGTPMLHVDSEDARAWGRHCSGP